MLRLFALLTRLAFWICLAIVLILSLTKDPDPSLGTGWDKSNHLLAFAVLALLGRLSYPGRRLLLPLGLLGYGLLIEVLQSMTGYRSADIEDLLADTLGILLGCLLASGGMWIKRRRYPVHSQF